MNYVIAASRAWYDDIPQHLAKRTGHKFTHITKKEDLTKVVLDKIQPRYIFFPHWSYIVPAEVYENFECVIFHMTDVPFGRGGSPLQNLIARGVHETKMTALRCSAAIDAGPVYFKEPLSLHGNAEEIYLRAARLIEKMICTLLANEPTPVEQEGDVVLFPRRKPLDGDVSALSSLDQVYDYIRMLDADGYPKAFLETGNFRLEFERSSLKYGKVLADVCITVREEHE